MRFLPVLFVLLLTLGLMGCQDQQTASPEASADAPASKATKASNPVESNPSSEAGANPPAEAPEQEMPAKGQDVAEEYAEEYIVEPPEAVKTPEGMVWIPGGAFTMGSEGEYNPHAANPDKIKPDEYPAHRVIVDGFWMDTTEVTNTEFARFVEETGYVTFAERKPKREDFIGVIPDVSLIPEENLVAGAIIFNENFDRENFRTDVPFWEYQAWMYQKGAYWKQPEGPGSHIDDRMDHPVVHVVYEDCLAYCRWAGKRLPTEAEWEYASRGGHEGWKYHWGNELVPDGKYMCNYWQGDFPLERKNLDGFLNSAPVGSYPPNDYGLYDMAGNVWEWVNDYYHIQYYRHSRLKNPAGPPKSFDPGEPNIVKRVTRGGSFMCNTNNCTGFRNAARMRSDVSSAAFHTGFRCVVDTKMAIAK